MSDTEIITATEASRAFSDLLHRVAYNGQSFVIKKGSRLMARIDPVTETVAETPKPKKEKAEKKSAPTPVSKPASQPEAVVQRRGVEPEPASLPTDDPDYYKQVVAEMNKMLAG